MELILKGLYMICQKVFIFFFVKKFLFYFFLKNLISTRFIMKFIETKVLLFSFCSSRSSAYNELIK